MPEYKSKELLFTTNPLFLSTAALIYICGIWVAVHNFSRMLSIILSYFNLTEYLLGDDVLVAPVVEKGAVTKDIYLPKGKIKI